MNETLPPPLPRPGLRLEAGGSPLYRRAPQRDASGRPLSDFMMLIPGLRDLPGRALQERVGRLEAVLGQFREVVFADLNLPLNLLWVSVRAKPGVILDIAAAVKYHLPEALIVGHR